MEEVIDTTELRSVVGENVAALRQAKGWTQKELAEKCGVQWPNVSRVENAHQMPSAELLFALADAFGVTADVLRKIPVHPA